MAYTITISDNLLKDAFYTQVETYENLYIGGG